MLQNIVMPKLGETMEEGTIVRWLINEGDTAQKGAAIMEVETDKAILEVESLVEGKVLKLTAPAGRTLPVGAVLGYVGDEDDMLPDEQGQHPRFVVESESGDLAPVTQESPPAAQARAKGHLRISPRAVKLAGKLGVDIAHLSGSGPNGRITSKDVQSFYDGQSDKPAASAAEIPSGRLFPHSRLRKITAEKMTLSRNTIPCFDLTVEVQTDCLLKLRSKLNASGTQKTAIHDFLILATAMALKQYPIMTGKWTEEGVLVSENPGIGLAIGLEDGLIAPVIRNVNNMNLRQIATASARLIDSARTGGLQPDELAGACITISNLGMLEIDNFTPIVIPGQGSILGVGKIKETVIAQDGNFCCATMLKLTLSVDHRLADGDYAARFLAAIKRYLEQPKQMIP